MFKRNFDGYDWTELAEVWCQARVLDEDNPKLLGDYISEINRAQILGQSTRVAKRTAEDIREYCKQLSQFNFVNYRKVWKAISEIEDDFTVMKVFSRLVDIAWS